MKKLLMLVPMLAFSAMAQTPVYQAVTVAVPATIGAAVNTNVALFLDCRRQQNVALQVSFNHTVAGASNVVFNLYPSVDGSTIDTSDSGTVPVAWTILGNGTTTTTWSTNFNIKGYGYLKLHSITNNHQSGAVSNLVFKYGVKTIAP